MQELRGVCKQVSTEMLLPANTSLLSTLRFTDQQSLHSNHIFYMPYMIYHIGIKTVSIYNASADGCCI